MTHRPWATAAGFVGAMGLVPTGLVAWAWCLHLWESGPFGEKIRSDPFLTRMPPLAWLAVLAVSVVVYGSMMGGPLLILAGAVKTWARNSNSASNMRTALVGAALLLAWSIFGLAVWPPDAAVRVVAAAMAAGSLFVLVTAWTRRRSATRQPEATQ